MQLESAIETIIYCEPSWLLEKKRVVFLDNWNSIILKNATPFYVRYFLFLLFIFLYFMGAAVGFGKTNLTVYPLTFLRCAHALK